MPRAPRPLYPGAFYHVVARGVAQCSIFLDRVDRATFLSQLARTAVSLGWRCHAYCLMTNHYHLVVETPDTSLSRGMQRLNGTYAQLFNERHERHGHLFQGRFGSTLIESEERFAEACHYVWLNPVRAGLCATPEDWPWSGGEALNGAAVLPAVVASADTAGV